MERQSSVKEVHKLNKQDYSGLYKALCAKLGEKNPFAKFSIGPGVYVWSDHRCQWHRMVDASELKQKVIQGALYQTETDMAEVIGAKTAQMLCTTPDDSYIYYNDDEGDVKILLTGWGFKKPVRKEGTFSKEPIKQKNPIRVSFSFDGNPMRNYEFGLRLPRQMKVLKTGDNGYYFFDNMKVGEHYVVTDLADGRDFPLLVVEGKSSYDFDLTKFAPLTISATRDGAPLANEPVVVDFHGKQYQATTNAQGCAEISLPLYDEASVAATMLDQTETTQLTDDGGQIVFSFESEKPEEKPQVEIQVSVMKDGEMLPSQPVVINYGDKRLERTTGPDGVLSMKMEEVPQGPCTVSVEGYAPQMKRLVNNAINQYVFEKTTATDNQHLTPCVVVKKKSGEVVGSYPIEVTYHDAKNHYQTDDKGVAALPEMKAGETMTVEDGVHHDNKAEYVLDKDQQEYVFFIPEEEVKQIKVMVRNTKGEPLVCQSVKFEQQGQQAKTVQLDENGDTFFEEGLSKLDTPVVATINKGSNQTQYAPISFTLEQDEYEYLLQEKTEKAGYGWWIVVVEVLVALATLWLLIVVWPFFEDFCSRMFHVIY